MRFRNLSAEELEGAVEIDGLDDWLRTVGATDSVLLILAPAGTGKAAAVGRLAHRLDRSVLLCNLMEIFDYDDPVHQLENLERVCDAQRNCVVYFDKLDKALAHWDRRSPGDTTMLDTLSRWLTDDKQNLLNANCAVVFTGRQKESIPESLLALADKTLVA